MGFLVGVWRGKRGQAFADRIRGIWPGLVLTKAAAKTRYKPLFATDFWDCQRWQRLVRVCPDPRRIPDAF